MLGGKWLASWCGVVVEWRLGRPRARNHSCNELRSEGGQGIVLKFVEGAEVTGSDH